MKAVFFDVDGTLVDTLHFIWASFDHTLKHFGLPEISEADVVHFQGAGLAECYAQIAPGIAIDELAVIHREFQGTHYNLAKAFPHALETLQILRGNGLHIAAITTRKQSVIPTLEETGLLHLLDFIVTSADVQNLKPDPEGVNKSLSHFQLEPHEACMVGDTIVDIQAGKNAGVETVGVTYGFYRPESFIETKPDHIIHDISEIIPLVLTSYETKSL